MKSIRQGLAVFLAALLMMPTLPASAQTVSSNDIVTTDVKAVEKTTADEVLFNTGNHAWSVVDPDISGNTAADAYFEEDGSFTINIPEANPFFPYEVQFTYDGEVTNEWFMTPDDSVEIGGHTFYVSAYFDDTVVTQMNLNVAGETVVVYPEKKEFTNDGDGLMPLSLLPLERRNLSVDLSSFTPAELTMVSVDSIFAGSNQIVATDKIVWNYYGEEDITISCTGDKLDLSYQTRYYDTNWTDTHTQLWEMIVGEADQLAADNILYNVSVTILDSERWLIPTVYVYDATGNRYDVEVVKTYYDDYDKEDKQWSIYISKEAAKNKGMAHIKLEVNDSLFVSPVYHDFKIYNGMFTNATEAMASTDITTLICGKHATIPGMSYSNINDGITMVTFDASGNVTGCLPFSIVLYNAASNYISCEKLFERNDVGEKIYVTNDSYTTSSYECAYTYTLYKEFSANNTYYMTIDYHNKNDGFDAVVTAAYVGNYNSIAEAQAAGATDIKSALCNDDDSTGGYPADYSKGVYFTIIIGNDGDANQEIYHPCIKTVTGSESKNKVLLNSGTNVSFGYIRDADGRQVETYFGYDDKDSYAEFNYLTILVEPDVDLTKLAPTFNVSSGAKLYVAGSSSPEESGKSYHDFSKGPVQYTVVAENGTDSKNYWLQVVKATDGVGKLYINSLADVDSKTKIENDIVYSTREIMLDGLHDYMHDIWIANMGTEALTELSAELVSDIVELDEYWTLKGVHELAGYSTINSNYHGTLPNTAKLRIKSKAGVEAGTEITGTLTIKSGTKILMVLNLTGIVGDPVIVTKEIPATVKYVPYGSILQNNNKYYSWNKVTYSRVDGALPAGMVVKPNGEIYGVPTEAGEFTFTVKMNNSHSSFADDTKTFTMVVNENTDANVDASTDKGYDLTQRVQDINLDTDLSGTSQTLVSQGEYVEFVDIYLDGAKLIAGTDYTSESGSTRITILNQTLAKESVGTHTLGIEFRTQDSDLLKRAAQNYEVTKSDYDDDSSEDDSDDEEDLHDDDSNGSSSNSSTSSAKGNAKTNTVAAVAGSAAANVGISAGYTIQSGDTLWTIAEKYYGSGSYWKKIYEDNADKISDPDKIFVGQQITLNPLTASEIAVPSDGSTYTVQSGDTLWKIAQKLYGKGWHWRKIYQLNEDIISDPENIYVGQVIRLPE